MRLKIFIFFTHDRKITLNSRESEVKNKAYVIINIFGG